MTETTERRERTLTDKDLDLLSERMQSNHCQFTPAEVSTIREMLDRIAETKSVVWKGFLSILFVVCVIAAIMACSHNLKIKLP